MRNVLSWMFLFIKYVRVIKNMFVLLMVVSVMMGWEMRGCRVSYIYVLLNRMIKKMSI